MGVRKRGSWSSPNKRGETKSSGKFGVVRRLFWGPAIRLIRLPEKHESDSGIDAVKKEWIAGGLKGPFPPRGLKKVPGHTKKTSLKKGSTNSADCNRATSEERKNHGPLRRRQFQCDTRRHVRKKRGSSVLKSTEKKHSTKRHFLLLHGQTEKSCEIKKKRE